jgi:hypothetical protein
VEDYGEAARLKVAIAAASNNDSVGKVIALLKVGILTNGCYTVSCFCALLIHNIVDIFNIFVYFPILQRAIKEERYGDAALLRDKAGAGLVSSYGSCLMATCMNIFALWWK